MTDQISIRINPDAIVRQVPTNYFDNDVVIISDMKEWPSGKPLHVDMIIVLLCVKGHGSVDINGKTHRIHDNELLICPPNIYLENYWRSPDFECRIIGLSYPALQRMLHVNREIWEMMIAVAASPVFAIDESMHELMTRYYTLLQFKVQSADTPYKRQAMHSLFQAIFFDLCEIVSQRTQQSEVLTNMKRGDLLVKQFLKLLADASGEQRSVEYFAEQLCVSAKYLSSTCKKSTGRTAKEWIREYTVEILRQYLRYSDLSIKEISNTLGFPNLSAFGKFVRTTLGMSPSHYRATLATTGR